MVVTPPHKTYQLMKHQAEAIAAANGRKYFAYFMEPGLGKTLAVIDEVQRLPVETIVVICPKSIMSVWYDEINKFAPTNGIDVWKGNYKTGHAKHWTIINIDAVNRVTVKVKGSDGNPIVTGTKCGKPVYQTKTYSEGFNTIHQILSGFDLATTMVVVDESTIIKNIDSKRTEAVMELGRLAGYRRILTGTPIANTPLDIYSQMVFLSPSIFPHSKNFFAFKMRYAIMGGYENRQVVGYKNLEHLATITTQHSFRSGKAECLDLPERTTQIRYVELSDKTWVTYRHLVDELVVEIGDSIMDMEIAVKKITKLRQLTGGWLKDDDGVTHRVSTEKFTELQHLLDECQGQKIIIWCQFTQEILEIQRAYPDAKVYHGKMTPKARDEAKHAFEHLPVAECPMIVIQNDTGSMGLTLNTATVSIFYSNPVYPLPKEQARDRNYRKGQTLPVTEYELIVKGSIDETIYVSIINRKSLAEAMLETRNDPEAIRKALIPKLPKVNWKAPSRGIVIKTQDAVPDLGPRPQY